MKKLIILSLSALAVTVQAQTVWTAQRCMQYAVEHNTQVRRAALELDNYEASRLGAVGNFLPSVNAGIGAQYNFGRAIDPETNGYTDVSTFYNDYSVYASLPVFDGFNRLHALRAAKASELMGRHALRQQQDLTALNVLQAYANAAFYDGLVRMADEKVKETELLLRQTRLLEEVGRKSAADVALVESQQAEAAYELTRQRSLYASSVLELKKEMAFPLSDSISFQFFSPRENDLFSEGKEAFLPGKTVFSLREKDVNCQQSSELQQARYQMEASRHEWHQARSSLYPSLSLSAGLSTTYFRTLHSEAAESFGKQFKNNMGEYIGATLSIPLFNRLQTATSIRRAKNNYQIAREAYEQKQLELEKLSREAWQDWQSYLKQAEQMTHKVEADSLAYQLTRSQFEEGLRTAIDLHTTSTQLLQSKATLLQCQLMAMVKEQRVRYYKGEQIWTE